MYTLGKYLFYGALVAAGLFAYVCFAIGFFIILAFA